MMDPRRNARRNILKKIKPDDTFAGDDLAGPDDSVKADESMEQFAGEFLGELASPSTGTIAKGAIVKVTPTEVYVDINMKTEGTIPISEFINDPAPQIGTPIEVYIAKVDEQEGIIQVSKNKARMIKAWDLADDAFQKGTTISARVVQKVKGGLQADFSGLKAFVPGSLMSLQQEYDLEKYVNQDFEFKIIELNRRRRNMVLSRKVILEEERKRVVAEIFGRLKVSDVCEGRIKNITEYGAFVSLEGGKIDGLLHKADMSWAHVRDINKFLKVGDNIQVKVLAIDRENEKISLGLKQLKVDPWTRIDEIVRIGDVVEGTVKNVTHFGAFVEIEEGIEGLVHISDMSWTERVRHPKDLVTIDQKVMVKVLNIDIKEKKIALGMKQVQPDPWSLVRENYQVGEVVKGVVRNITDFGAFVELTEGVEGLVHISDMSWTGRVKHPSELVAVGATIEVKILEIDTDNKRISLGLKQVSPDPWELIEDNHSVGDLVKGKVRRLVDFGAFVEIGEGIEGLVHISDFSWTERVEHPSSVLQEGQEVQVKILEIDKPNRRLSLGLKQLQDDPWSVVERRFPVGTLLEGKVTRITNFGAFVEIEPGLEGLVHVSDFSWTEKVAHPIDKVKEGDVVKVRVQSVDKVDRKIALSIKHIEPDPLDLFSKAHPTGSVVQGTVTSVTDFGIFVKLPFSLEGLVHKSQVGEEPADPSKAIKPDDTVTVKVLDVEKKERRIRLSIKQAKAEQERAKIEEYSRKVEKEAGVTLGDQLDEKTRDKLKKARRPDGEEEQH